MLVNDFIYLFLLLTLCLLLADHLLHDDTFIIARQICSLFRYSWNFNAAIACRLHFYFDRLPGFNRVILNRPVVLQYLHGAIMDLQAALSAI